jgi:hypothetical protein
LPLGGDLNATPNARHGIISVTRNFGLIPSVSQSEGTLIRKGLTEMLHMYLSFGIAAWTVGSIVMMHSSCKRNLPAKSELTRDNTVADFANDLRLQTRQSHL